VLATPAPNGPRVIVTRPALEAQGWVDELRARGLAADALPLIEITAVPDATPVRAAWQQLAAYAALMFVSANAVRHFFEQRPTELAVALPRCLATGPGTRRALLQCGVGAQAIDAPAPGAPQFDSEALWQLVGAQPWAGRRVLIVRGGQRPLAGQAAPDDGAGRNWLAQQWTTAGAQVDFLPVYWRGAPDFDARALQFIEQAVQQRAVWLFSSSEAIEYLPLRDWSAARAVATHARIAAAARRAGFGVVCESRPALDDVVRSIESLA
jgi:uroporphyrinogen-III synthase